MELRELRRWVYGYHCKRGRDPDPHPPDDKILAQLLAIAPLYRLVNLIETLTGEPKKDDNCPYGYGWYATVAAQRIHGISAEMFKARKAELRIAKKPPAPAIEGTQEPLPLAKAAAAAASPAPADPAFAQELITDLKKRVGKVR